MSVPVLYSLVGVALFCIALRAVILATAPLRAILAVNVMSSGVFLVLVALAAMAIVLTQRLRADAGTQVAEDASRADP
jgi:multisubunit Na+/H+ antiporter MnhC subunit